MKLKLFLHDNLISQEILNINTSAEKIYVGRKYGDKSDQGERQDNINQLLVMYYQLGKKVVRIKSGDPIYLWKSRRGSKILNQVFCAI